MIADRARSVGRAAGSSAIRWPLMWLGLGVAAVFVVDTVLAIGSPYLAFDVPLERFIQAVSWGPLTSAFRVVDWIEGVRQIGLAAAGFALVLAVHRRAALLFAIGAASGPVYTVTELLIHRARPSAALVHVVRHTNGFSYPSGHAVFFAWFCVLLILCLGLHRLHRVVAGASWVVAALIVLAVCVGRVYDGEHWPSDVVGGVALGGAWTAIALSVRRLSAAAIG